MCVFKSVRALAAPPAAVFAAFKDGARLAKWWGPSGFTNQFKVFEFNPGGRWLFDMIGPDGKVYPNESVFTRIVEDRLILISHVCEPHFELRVGLEPLATGTRLTWEQTFADAALAEAVRHIVEPSNEQNLDRLAAELG